MFENGGFTLSLTGEPSWCLDEAHEMAINN